MTENKDFQQEETQQSINILDILLATLRHWPWIIVSVAICVGIATYYNLKALPIYSRSAEIVIKDDSKGKSISSETSFADMGLVQTKSNINDEINKIKSPDVMNEVVKRLSLDINYFTPGRFHNNVIYGSTLPVRASFPSLLEDESASAIFDINNKGLYTISNISRDGQVIEFTQTTPAPLDSTITTPLGAVTLSKTDYYRPGTPYTIIISKSPVSSTAAAYAGALNVSRLNDKGSTIQISIDNTNPQRAEDVINAVIDVYNEVWMQNRNQIATSTSNFINERLNSIEHELGNVDQDISSYQSEHLIPDVQQAASMYMAENQAASAQILDLNNQLQMTRYMRSFLSAATNRNEIIPANVGIGNPSIERLISEYNTIMTERNQYAANSSEAHPKVMALDVQIANMRSSIIASIDNQIIALNTQIKNLQSTKSQTTAQIAANPTQAKYLLSVERQQKVKESLYLFLLQKREENELSQAFTPYNTQIIVSPRGPAGPVGPHKARTLMIAFLIGLLIPFGVEFARETLNTKVRGRKDLDKLTVPFIGEIPQIKKSIHEIAVVKQGNRNIVNEAFRVLRTNLGFMTPTDSKSAVILTTSFTAGSGKTFVTVNLALSFAIRGKRVLIIDGDLRHASSSTLVNSPSTGFADYLADKVNDISSVIVKSSESDNLFILPVGTIPPNPTELLESDRFPQLIEKLRSQFDYIFIDCPPFEVMADAQIINSVVDRAVVIIRAGHLDRSMLPELEKIYRSKRFNNIGMVLNGTAAGSAKYGNKYGYGYGYGDYNKYNKYVN